MFDIDINDLIPCDYITETDLLNYIISRYSLFNLKKARHDGSLFLYLDSRYDVCFQIELKSCFYPYGNKMHYTFGLFCKINDEFIPSVRSSCATISYIDSVIDLYYDYI